jgi:alpha-glucosidase
MRLEAKQDASLQANFTEKNGFVVPGEIVTPWRVIMLADDLNELVNSDIISNLNPAPDAKLFADQSWIKPGRSVWSFWSSWGEPYYMTLPYEKHLIDRAVEINYESLLTDKK